MNKVGFFRSIQLKFIIIYILLLLLAMQVIGTFFMKKLEDELLMNYTESISERMDLLSYNLEQAFNKERTEDGEGLTLHQEVQQIVDEISIDTALTSIQVINNQGRIIGTNDSNYQKDIGKKTSQDIIDNALFFNSFKDDIMLDEETQERVYVQALPLYDKEGTVVGIIYAKAPIQTVYDQLNEINDIFIQGSILAIGISAFLGILVARTITKPIMEMRRQAQIMAKGDFTQKVNVYGKDEIGQLAETFNDLNSRLKHSYATIEEERRKLSSVLLNMSDGVISIDNSGIITLTNESAGRLIGQNPDDIIGDYFLDVLQLEDKIVDITELQDSGSIIIDFSEDDEPLLIRANFSTVVDDEDEITGFIAVLSDVTEQEKVEQERREFVSNVSHELRTPLTTMKSYIEALTEGAWQDKEIAPRFLNVAQNETDRMIRMVNDLLQLSKLDQDEYPMHKERTEFIGYFHHVIDRLEMNIPEQLTFKRELPKGLFYVWIDKDKMTQVLDNIISNAIKYSPEGGEIRLKVEQKRHHLLISVKDEGIGIAYDKLDKIFERFYRADKARSRKLGGTGLGLAITKELIEAHHGKIWAKSKEGKGTTILFTLPLMNQKRRGR
ncbi:MULTISPECIES: cell wall metabolism sensor histidine kinase WalK [Bacillaceae]|uniref:histidine kinase n=1 Tax=Oceanobacillus caeni TaxID=405946 RepID=A0ABR5MGQ7_9BACI|nr:MULTISPECIES: cell wall metabolism sensor histidine kinase WalK [Bacillaceae]KKE78294.1 histidine kinase [Bacilli bacterium VT-13-104]PZD84886.1 cell wall metabolism sensor histidine kinase WalK [Bacilli bacterium]KPH72117.1 histidine kinase [Oceanobacillus caeni]MBU8790850.1 cell wall metabolism sensor histidine kinase WalK [Oceanobacillus caeni]MED4473306.1 cell wall metabolism sensor histidine kinase WalK [Oceanobacillus caeni]